jgi:hypothetical protein
MALVHWASHVEVATTSFRNTNVPSLLAHHNHVNRFSRNTIGKYASTAVQQLAIFLAKFSSCWKKLIGRVRYARFVAHSLLQKKSDGIEGPEPDTAFQKLAKSLPIVIWSLMALVSCMAYFQAGIGRSGRQPEATADSKILLPLRHVVGNRPAFAWRNKKNISWV